MANGTTRQYEWVQGEPKKLDPPFTSEHTPKLEGKYLDKCRKLMAGYDRETAEDWREGINTQLLVSTLLSAVTTAFIIEAQKNLKEDPANTAVVMLGKILQHLNQTAELDTEIKTFTSATTIDKLINAFWFTSLAFSLATVTIGLLCLQWIQEYKKDGDHLSQEQYFNFRYARERGFKDWRAEVVIVSLPLLLIFSLITFFGGLLVFLGTTNWAVAIPVYFVLLVTVVFLILTTFLPGIIAVRKARSAHINGINKDFRFGDGLLNPPFRSPQSWLALKICLGIAFAVSKLRPMQRLRQYQDWVRVDVQWAEWSKDLCRMSLQPLLNLFADSTEKNTTAICRTLDEFTSNMSRKGKDIDANCALVYQLQAFPLVVNLSILHENSSQCTDASRLEWTDYLVERYTGTVASWSELPGRKTEQEFWERLDHAFWKFQNTLAGIPAGQGNFNLLTRLLARYLEDYRVIGERRDRATIFWITLGLVLTHPSLEPQYVEKVVSDSLGAIKRIDEEHEVIPGRKMDMVIGVIHALTDKLEKDRPRARHVLDCLSKHSLWPQLHHSIDIKELIPKVQTQEAVQFRSTLPDRWETFEERQDPSPLPAEPLPDSSSSVVEQAAAASTEDDQVPEAPPIHSSRPPRPPLPASIQTPPQPGRRGSSHLSQSTEVNDPLSPSAMISPQIDSGYGEGRYPFSHDSPHRSPERSYFSPMRTKTSQVTIAGDEAQALLSNPMDTAGE